MKDEVPTRQPENRHPGQEPDTPSKGRLHGPEIVSVLAKQRHRLAPEDVDPRESYTRPTRWSLPYTGGMSTRFESTRTQVRLQGTLLALIAALSYFGEGWGYLLLYVFLLVLLAAVILTVRAAARLRERVGRARSPRDPDTTGRILANFALAEAILLSWLVIVAVVAGLSSGPIGAFPGGELTGRPVTEPVEDWSFAEDVEEIQMQVSVGRPRSITTHFLVHEGNLYVGADFLFPHKRWVHDVLEDDRVILRIRGNLYPRRAVRITDPTAHARLLEAAARKIGAEPDDFLTEVWFFRMDPRDQP
jgi:hypothetical protein